MTFDWMGTKLGISCRSETASVSNCGRDERGGHSTDELLSERTRRNVSKRWVLRFLLSALVTRRLWLRGVKRLLKWNKERS